MGSLGEALPGAQPEVWPKPEFVPEYSAVARAHDVPVQVPGAGFVDRLSHVRVLVSPVPSVDYTVAPPLTWLEAAQCGAVVVTTPCGGIPSSLVDGGAIVVAKHRSVAALREAILAAWRSDGPQLGHMPTARAAAERYARLWRMDEGL
jgi:glycosyltransferase involved in cell wall biosynthesis